MLIPTLRGPSHSYLPLSLTCSLRDENANKHSNRNMTFTVEGSRRVEGRRLVKNSAFPKVKTALSKSVAIVRGTASTTNVSCPPFPFFFYLPAEIRFEIFWFALLAHTEIYARFDKYQANRFTIAPGERPDPIRLYPEDSAYWGSKYWSMILPVCRQWYQEIQAVFYSRFDFNIFVSSHIEESQSPYLDFLPPHTLPLIRHVHISLIHYWDELLEIDSPGDLLRQCDDIAASLTGLTRVDIGINGMNEGYIHPHLQIKFIELVVRLCRSFATICDTEVHGTYWGRNEDSRGIPLELLLPECRRILEEEFSKYIVGGCGTSLVATALSYRQDNV